MTATRPRDRLTRAQAHAEIVGVIDYARSLAGRRRRDFEERFAEALLGLCEAARTFEPSRGLKFSTHATFQVRSRFSHAARKRVQAGMTYVPPATSCPCRPLTDVFADDEHAALAARVTLDPPPDESDEFWRRVRRVCVCRRDYLILRARYAHGLALSEIAAGLGVTKTRVRQRIGRTLARLRAQTALFEGFR